MTFSPCSSYFSFIVLSASFQKLFSSQKCFELVRGQQVLFLIMMTTTASNDDTIHQTSKVRIENMCTSFLFS